MLSEEEKKAINNMKLFARVHQDMTVVTANEMDIILNLIEKQQAEIEKKDKIIDLMAEKICFFDIDLLVSFDNEIQCVEYFTNKVKEEK